MIARLLLSPRYFDYAVYLAIPAGALGLIVAGGMLIAGNPNGTKWLARTAAGVGVLLLAQGITAVS